MLIHGANRSIIVYLDLADLHSEYMQIFLTDPPNILLLCVFS